MVAAVLVDDLLALGVAVAVDRLISLVAVVTGAVIPAAIVLRTDNGADGQAADNAGGDRAALLRADAGSDTAVKASADTAASAMNLYMVCPLVVGLSR